METTDESDLEKAFNSGEIVENEIPSNKKRKIVLLLTIICVVVASGVLAAIFIPGIIEEKQKQDIIANTRSNLESCLSEIGNSKHDALEYIDGKIKCYEKNDVEESEEEINSLKELRKTTELNSCLAKARSDYAVTEGEINAAYASGITAMNAVSDKMIGGYNAEILCYKTYDEKNSASQISELEKKIITLKSSKDAANSYNNSYSAPSYSNPVYTPPSVSVPETPKYTCEDYYSVYYSEYTSAIKDINSSYNSLITNAHNSCIYQHGSFGGCPAASSFERQRDQELAQEKVKFRQKLTDVGCEDYYNL